MGNLARFASTLLSVLPLMAGCQAPGPCADNREVAALPSPLWETGALLAPPAGDKARALIASARPAWLKSVGELDGWPARPTLLVPLSEAVTEVDASALTLFGAAAGEKLEAAALQLTARLEDSGRTLIVELPAPMPGTWSRAVLAARRNLTTTGQPLPVCGDDAKPHPAYEAALRELPGGSESHFALPFRLDTSTRVLPNLWRRLSTSPALKVESAAAHALDSYGSAAPPPAVAAVLAPQAAQGILELPDYRGPGGVWRVTGDGGPVAQGSTRPGFVVVLPRTGAPPYPVVLFQHGGGQNKLDVFQLAGPLAAAGFAFVAIDLPLHGDRAGSGSSFDFVDAEAPLRTRDNFRQTAADHMAVLSGLDALNAGLAPLFGSAATLDSNRTFYMGLSLGAVSGSLTFSTTPTVRAAALFVGGAGFDVIVQEGMFSLFFLDLLELAPAPKAAVLGLVEALLNGADPLAYAQAAEPHEVPPRPLLLMEAADDPVISAAATDLWALAFGAALARPSHHAVAGMRELSLPAADNFAWEEGGARATRLLVHNPMAEVSVNMRHGGLIVQGYSQAMVSHCFATFLGQGRCEIIDTGFAQR